MAYLTKLRGTLTGLVTYKGNPVVVGTVVAHCSDGVRRTATLDSQGRYTIEGIPHGKVQVGVISRDPTRGMLRQLKMAKASDRLPEEDRETDRPGVSGKWFATSTSYEDPRWSGLETTVEGMTEFPINLQ